MRKALSLFLLIFLVSGLQSFAQGKKDFLIRIRPIFNGYTLQMDSIYVRNNYQDTIAFHKLKFFLSSFKLVRQHNVVFEEANSYHLIDFSDSSRMLIRLHVPNNILFDELHFNLGVDSAMQVNGAKGGDLDPTLGMYWTWQSGYINLKLEGRSQQCQTPKNEFQFHLGGYAFPDKSLQSLAFPIFQATNAIVDFDLTQWLAGIDFRKQHHIMLPGKEAVVLSKQVANCFKINQ